jgi:hypothetical protein
LTIDKATRGRAPTRKAIAKAAAGTRKLLHEVLWERDAPPHRFHYLMRNIAQKSKKMPYLGRDLQTHLLSVLGRDPTA